MVCKIKMDF